MSNVMEMMLSEGNVKMRFKLDGLWSKIPELINEVKVHGLKISRALQLADQVIVDGFIVKDRLAVYLAYNLKIEGKNWSAVKERE